MKVRGLIIILISLFLLASCSSRQLGYRYAENLVAWQLNQSISLDRQQRRELRAELDRFLQWHAETQMPAYYQFLQTLEGELYQQPMTEEKLADYSEQVLKFWYDFRLELLPYAMRFLAELSSEQQQNLIVSLQERFTDDEQADSSQSELHQERIKQMEARVKTGFGRLHRQQQTYIADWAATSLDNRELWQAYQLAWLDGFANAMMLPPDSDVYQALISRLFLTPEEWRSDALQETVAHNEQTGTRLLLDLINSSDARQQRHLRREIERLRRDLRGMMRQRGVSV